MSLLVGRIIKKGKRRLEEFILHRKGDKEVICRKRILFLSESCLLRLIDRATCNIFLFTPNKVRNKQFR